MFSAGERGEEVILGQSRNSMKGPGTRPFICRPFNSLKIIGKYFFDRFHSHCSEIPPVVFGIRPNFDEYLALFKGELVFLICCTIK